MFDAATNIMAIFVHNEPTCLPVIQEAGLPEVFYGIIEKGLEPVIEVIQSVPNALGALCLNQAGQDQLTARPDTIPSLFSIFTSEDHQRVLQEKENAVLIGTSVEELRPTWIKSGASTRPLCRSSRPKTGWRVSSPSVRAVIASCAEHC